MYQTLEKAKIPEELSMNYVTWKEKGVDRKMDEKTLYHTQVIVDIKHACREIARFLAIPGAVLGKQEGVRRSLCESHVS